MSEVFARSLSAASRWRSLHAPRGGSWLVATERNDAIVVAPPGVPIGRDIEDLGRWRVARWPLDRDGWLELATTVLPVAVSTAEVLVVVPEPRHEWVELVMRQQYAQRSALASADFDGAGGEDRARQRASSLNLLREELRAAFPRRDWYEEHSSGWNNVPETADALLAAIDRPRRSHVVTRCDSLTLPALLGRNTGGWRRVDTMSPTNPAELLWDLAERQRAMRLLRGSLADTLVDMLARLGVHTAFGVRGRELGAIWRALVCTDHTCKTISTVHLRHETAASLAALGSWTQSRRPTVLLVTTQPGLASAAQSLRSARAVGAKIVLVSPLVRDDEEPLRDPDVDDYMARCTFDLAMSIDSRGRVDELAEHLAAGFSSSGSFLAHIAIPAEPSIDNSAPASDLDATSVKSARPHEIAAVLAAEPFAVCVGSGARPHSAAIRRLLDITGAPAISSPGASEVLCGHSQFLGTTGDWNRSSGLQALTRHAPARILVLGSSLDHETRTSWPDNAFVSPNGFIHVDVDSSVFVNAFPNVPTLGVHADIGEFLDALLEHPERLIRRTPTPDRIFPDPIGAEREQGWVDPSSLLTALWALANDDVPVLVDASTSMFWGSRGALNQEEREERLVSNRFGQMGGAVAAVLGAAAARGGPALAIAADAAMHVHDEISTAVRHRVRAIWVVINASAFGKTCYTARRSDANMQPTDYAAAARAMGADAVRVTSTDRFEAALHEAISGNGPFVVDVVAAP